MPEEDSAERQSELTGLALFQSQAIWLTKLSDSSGSCMTRIYCGAESLSEQEQDFTYLPILDTPLV